ncbi:MAG: N-acetyltransferase [Pseudomonas sp.]|nr:N-acetyltransferase [Pseudomonas sp.]
MSDPAIVHDATARRFSLEVDGHRAELEYQLHGGTLAITHTGVPEAIGGRGIAARLVEAAFAHARAAGLKVRPSCSYAAAWVERHPEVRDLLG